MKEDIKKLWLDTLRSEKYEQGVEALKSTNDKFCCLGVLCDLHRTHTGQGYWKEHTEGTYCYFISEEDCDSGILPQAVSDWAGLSDENPVIGDGTATEYNDERRLSFSEISDLIEKNL
jgi:hypothetical protein